jgi:phosphoglycolate phosphatase-like HAD superfamily hydrolase
MKLFVWDLHGTLEQGNENAAIEISNLALDQHGYKQRFKPGDSRTLYGLKWYEYFEWLLPEESYETHVALQSASFELSDAHPEIIARYMHPTAHAHDVLAAIQNSPHEQILISNTKPSSVPLYLKALGMDRFFQGGTAYSVNAHAKEAKRGKEDILAEHVSSRTFDDVIVIGDSNTDLKLAQAFKATSYIYTHPGYDFRANGGDYRITDLREILQSL